MKKIIKKIEIEIENLRTHIQKRHDKIDSMSAKWQESEKGENYYDKTMEIEEFLNDLIIVIDDLKQI